MTQPTKEQWDEVAKQLDRIFDAVYLRCDGFIISAVMRRTGKNKLSIIVGVNGWHFKGEWFPFDGREMAEEARRFWRPVKRAKYSAKGLRTWEKLIGKRACRKRGYYETYILRTPEWLRPRPFIRHLIEHNESIEILDYAEYQSALAALGINYDEASDE